MKDQFVHQVLFWTAADADTEKLARGLEALQNIEGVNDFIIGRPANNSHKFSMVDNGYQLVLLVCFDTEAQRDRYEADAIHTKVVEDNAQYWTKVAVYDFVN